MLDYNEFYEELWGNVSASIVSEDFMSENSEFINAITFNLYDLYEKDGNVSINFLRRILVSFMFNFKIFRLNEQR